MLEKKAHRSRLWKIFGSEQFLRVMWVYCTLKSAWDKEDIGGRSAEQSRRNTGSMAKRISIQRSLGASQKKCGYRLRAGKMRRAYSAMKLGNWESFIKEECRKGGKLWEWTIERLQEAYEKVASEDIGRLGIAQEILRKTRTS